MGRRDPDLPDGWIRTPLPPRRVEETPEASWFARTGEPAPPRRPAPAPEALPAQRVAVVLVALGVVFAIATVIGILLLGS